MESKSRAGSRIAWLLLGGLVGAGGAFVALNGVPRPVGADASPAAAASPDATRPPARTAVELAEVRRGDVASVLELTGNILPRRRTIILSEVDGVIQSFGQSSKRFDVEIDGRRYAETPSINIGDAVSEGDVLAQIDPRDIELELSAARARLLKAQKDLEELLSWKRPEEVRRMQAGRAEAEARLQLATASLTRVERLVASRASTPSELDDARTEYRMARAALDRAEAELALATAGPTEAEIAVAESLVAQAEADVEIQRRRLEKTTIRAPYDGVITERFVDEGERVTAQPRVEILEIMDLGVAVVQVSIPERYLHRVRVNDWVAVRAQGAREPAPALVVAINDKVDPQTRTFRVRLAAENLDDRFKPGQFIRADFPIEAATDALIVPSRALVYSGGQAQAFVLEDGQARLRNVRTGLDGDGVTEILDGLSAGERVVVDDPSILADGMLVRARETRPTSGDAGRGPAPGPEDQAAPEGAAS